MDIVSCSGGDEPIEDYSSTRKRMKASRILDSFPMDCWSYIVSFFDSPGDFLRLSLSIKHLYDYVLVYNPFCLRNIQWKISTIPNNTLGHVSNVWVNSDLNFDLNEVSQKYPNLTSLSYVDGDNPGNLIFSKFLRLARLEIKKSSSGNVIVCGVPSLESISMFPIDEDEEEIMNDTNLLQLCDVPKIAFLRVRRWKVVTSITNLSNLVTLHLEDVILKSDNSSRDEKIRICKFFFLEFIIVYGKNNISEIRDLPALKCLRYRFSEFNSPRVLIDSIESLPELEHIEIHFAQIPIADENFKLERICNLPKLSSLFIRNADLGSSRRTVLYNLPKLEHLYVHLSPFSLLEPISPILKSIRISTLPIQESENVRNRNHFDELSWIKNTRGLLDLRLYIFPYRKKDENTEDNEEEEDDEDEGERNDPLDSPKMRKFIFQSPKKQENWLLDFFNRGGGCELEYFTIIDRRKNEEMMSPAIQRGDSKYIPEYARSACFSGLLNPTYFLNSEFLYESLTKMDVYIETDIEESFELIRETCPSLVDFKFSIMKQPSSRYDSQLLMVQPSMCVIGELDFSVFSQLERLSIGANVVNHTQCQMFGDGFFFEESDEYFERDFKFIIEDDFITEVDDHNFEYADDDEEQDEFDAEELGDGPIQVPTTISIGVISIEGLENLELLHIDLSRLKNSLHVTRIHVSDCHVRNAYVRCKSDLYLDNLPNLKELTVINGTKSCELRNLPNLRKYTMEISPLIRDTICNFQNLKNLVLFSNSRQKMIWCEIILQNLPMLEKVNLDETRFRDIRVGVTVRNCPKFILNHSRERNRNEKKNVFLIPDFLKEKERLLCFETGY